MSISSEDSRQMKTSAPANVLERGVSRWRGGAAALAALLLVAAPAARADVVHDWNGIMVATIAGQNPYAQARTAAIVQPSTTTRYLPSPPGTPR